MKVFNSASPPTHTSKNEREWIYNGQDTAITIEVLDALLPQLDNLSSHIYNFERNLQIPALEMMLRGFRVDEAARQQIIQHIAPRKTKYGDWIDAIATVLWGKGLNPNSPKQCQELLYKVLGLPKQYRREGNKRLLTTNRNALEKLELQNIYFTPLIRLMMLWHDDDMLLRALRTGVDSDGRFRFSMNVGSTETGRWSSSKNIYQRGTNAQNLTNLVRKVFVADEGYTFFNFDLVTAESLGVAYLSGDQAYKDACLSGDLHTFVTKLIWPELPWEGDQRADRAIADRPFFRHFSYRDMAKRGGHLTNYVGSAWTMARHLRLPQNLCEEFQRIYFRRFPKIAQWHKIVKATLQTDGALTTPLGRRRYFFDRPDSDATLREAVAFVPQSTIVDIINTGMLNVFRALREVQLVVQVHDSVLYQVPDNRIELVPEIIKLMTIPVDVKGDTMTIGVEGEYGWNWAKMNLKSDVPAIYNEYGLRGIGKNGPAKNEFVVKQLHGIYGGS